MKLTNKSLISIPTHPIQEVNSNGRQLKALSLPELLATEFPPREYMLSPWLLTQSIAMVYSKRGVGKTWFNLEIAFAVATGGTFLGWKASRRYRVLYVDGEMTGVELQERMRLIVARTKSGEPPPDNLSFFNAGYHALENPDLSSPLGQKLLEPLIEQADLIIFDNISTLFRGNGKENESGFAAPINHWLLKLKQKHRKTIILVHHAGKEGQQRGTSKTEDVHDVILCLKAPPGHELTDGARFRVVYDKGRNFSKDFIPLSVAIRTEDGFIDWDYSPSKSEETPSEPTWLPDAIALKGENKSYREIGKVLGVSPSTLQRHLKPIFED